jgi:hypothetical protein
MLLARLLLQPRMAAAVRLLLLHVLQQLQMAAAVRPLPLLQAQLSPVVCCNTDLYRLGTIPMPPILIMIMLSIIRGMIKLQLRGLSCTDT